MGCLTYCLTTNQWEACGLVVGIMEAGACDLEPVYDWLVRDWLIWMVQQQVLCKEGLHIVKAWSFEQDCSL